MTQAQRRAFLIKALLDERSGPRPAVPPDEEGRRRLLRSLMNVRPPRPIGEEFLSVQDEYLREETAVDTVRRYRGDIEVIFNVFKDTDRKIYADLLGVR